MDMERIKQNLRLRSGRSKKTSKKFPTARSGQKPPANQDKELPHRPISQPQPQRTISAQPETDSPSLRIWDQDTALPQKHEQKPEQAPKESSTPQYNGLNSHPPDVRPKTAQNQSTRYGKSGIERNQSKGKVQEPEPTMPQENKRPDEEPPSPDGQDFDLRPPPSKPRPTSIDILCEMLFSAGHLNILIYDPQLMSRFSVFLNRYRPEMSAVVLQYLEYQKAIKAIEYANALAQTITPIPAIQDVGGSQTPTQENANPHGKAAELSKSFAETSQRAYDLLVHEALPAYITYTLVRLATECLTAEITSTAPTSLTSNLIGGLSEVFCLSDPTLPDNPLIYCSEEFFRLTGYTPGDVLGQNCRFLQGPKTDQNSVRRIREAVTNGEGCNEVILNYRRDGRGFVNILMISPLADDKGKVKYFLGAQIDVSRLVAGGWGLEGLERLVQKREMEEIRGRRIVKSKKDEALRKLRELSEMFDLEESAVVQSHSRSSSMDRGEIGSGAASAGGSDRPRQARRVFGDDGEEGSSSEDDESGTSTEETDKERSAWTLATTGSSGKLPGVYQSYLLIRPAPSSRIIFVSPALRKKGNIVQKPFLSHIAAPPATLSGLKESLGSGTPVTAKVAFMAEPGSSRDGTPTGRWRRTNSKGKNDQVGENDKDPSRFGRTCWISATPLLGGDGDIGVWMVVLVDKNTAPGRTLSGTKGQGMKHQQLEGRAAGIAKAGERNEQIQMLSDDIRKDDIPIKPIRVGGTSVNGTPRKAENPSPPEDREAAREMYDNDGNEAVQQEACEEDSQYTSFPRTDGPSEDAPARNNYSEEEGEREVQAKDDADFERVPKANSADDEGSGSGPAEEENHEHYTAHDKPQSLQDVIASKQHDTDEDDSETFVRHRSSAPTPPNTKERVVIRSDSSSDAEREADVDTAANDSFPGHRDAEEDEGTPTRARHDRAHHDEEGDGSRPGTSNTRAPFPMDYLRHPGTREQRKKAEGETTPSDPDCSVWSPYSVD